MVTGMTDAEWRARQYRVAHDASMRTAAPRSAACGMSRRMRCLRDVTALTARRVAAIVLVASALLGSSVAASSPVVVDVQHDDDAFVIEASATLRADEATAWRILTAYGEYAR